MDFFFFNKACKHFPFSVCRVIRPLLKAFLNLFTLVLSLVLIFASVSRSLPLVLWIDQSESGTMKQGNKSRFTFIVSM